MVLAHAADPCDLCLWRYPKILNRVGNLKNHLNMKETFQKFVAHFTGAKIHADHTAIKGDKSGGSVDSSTVYKHWRKDGTSEGTR